jgi:hypothetical protein
MLELTKGQAAEKIILTLTELTTLAEPNFLFIFVHTLTRAEVKFVKLNSDDESDYPSRFNKFTVNTAVLFLNQPVGEWLYTAYEQASAVNTDPLATTGVVETGKMMLKPASEFEYEMYEEPTTYKTYAG